MRIILKIFRVFLIFYKVKIIFNMFINYERNDFFEK